MLRYKIIVNPIAGRGAGLLAIPIIGRALKDHGLDHDIVRTERPWHGVELARNAVEDGYDVGVAVGGDGTCNEVLNGLMLAQGVGLGRACMGVLPVGRGNDFAYGMGVPADLPAACQALACNARRLIDVGRVVGGLYPQGRYFGNGVGIGFDAVVGFEAVKMKHLHGFANYVVAALKTMCLYFRAPLLQITYGGQTITQNSLMVSVMNGRRMGGGFMMAPDSISDDGLLDLCIARQVSRAGILALIPRFMQGTQASHAAIRTGRAPKVVVRALEGVLPAHADGETLCTEGQQLEIEVLSRQIELVCQPVGS